MAETTLLPQQQQNKIKIAFQGTHQYWLDRVFQWSLYFIVLYFYIEPIHLAMKIDEVAGFILFLDALFFAHFSRKILYYRKGHRENFFSAHYCKERRQKLFLYTLCWTFLVIVRLTWSYCSQLYSLYTFTENSYLQSQLILVFIFKLVTAAVHEQHLHTHPDYFLHFAITIAYAFAYSHFVVMYLYLIE